MTQVPLAPPPPTGGPLDGWLYLLWRRLTQAGQILWSSLDFTGSNLTDLATRNHEDLQNINTASYTHLTAAQVTDLTDGGDSALHYHASDRDSANFTGVSWTDLTDGGVTALHSHTHNSMGSLQGGTAGEYYHLSNTEYLGNYTYTASISKTITADFNGAGAVSNEVKTYNATYPAGGIIGFGNIANNEYNFLGGGSATLPGATAFRQNLTYNTTKDHETSTTLFIGNNCNITVNNTGNIGAGQIYRARGFLSSSGSATTAAQFAAAGWSLSSTGAITTSYGLDVQAATGHATLVTTAIGVRIENMSAVTNVYGIHSSVTSGVGSWNFYAAGTANNAYAGNSSFGQVVAPIAAVDTTSFATNLVTNTGATYTVLTTDHTIIQTTAASVYTLPAASSFTGRILHLVTQFAGTVTSASSNVVPIAGGAAGTAILAATAGKFATLQSDGTNWIIIASN